MTDPDPTTPAEADKLRHFAANVAHDFNNLLTGILGNLELMQNRAARTQVTTFDAYLEGARNAGARAATFAQRLLAFSGRTAQEVCPVAIDIMIHEIVEPMREHGMPLTVQLNCGAAQILCDPSQADLALHELLNNAAEAVHEGGAIRLATEFSGGQITITISDTGPGMAPETLARAVEPFFTTRPNGAGKGLGLSIAHRFAEHAGGLLEINSTPGEGTQVKLVLPGV